MFPGAFLSAAFSRLPNIYRPFTKVDSNTLKRLPLAMRLVVSSALLLWILYEHHQVGRSAPLKLLSKVAAAED